MQDRTEEVLCQKRLSRKGFSLGGDLAGSVGVDATAGFVILRVVRPTGRLEIPLPLEAVAYLVPVLQSAFVTASFALNAPDVRVERVDPTDPRAPKWR